MNKIINEVFKKYNTFPVFCLDKKKSYVSVKILDFLTNCDIFVLKKFDYQNIQA